MKKFIFLFNIIIFLTTQNFGQTVTDIDGNVYNTVIIGSQIWLQQNLNVIHYRNGDTIPNITGDSQWENLAAGAYCNYANDSNFAAIHGRLYNWHVVSDNRKICPIGWHIPDTSDWRILVDNFSDVNTAAEELSSIDYGGACFGTNESGFTAIASGGRTPMFDNSGHIALWWTVSSASDTSANWFYILCMSDFVSSFSNGDKNWGASIRCVCDSTVNKINEIDKENDFLLYPTLTKDKITIECAVRQDLFLFVYNTIGQLLLQKELNENINVIDISTLPAGMYIIKVTSGIWTAQKRIIKE